MDVEIKASLVFREGKPYAVQGIARDITTRKRIEEALRQSEEKYRSLVSNIPDVAWTLDAELRFAYISPRIESVTGFPLEEVYRRGASL